MLAVAGSVSTDLGDYQAAGIRGVASIVTRPMTLEEAMQDGASLVEDASRRMVEVFVAGREARHPG